MIETRLTISIVVYRTPVSLLEPLFCSLSAISPSYICIVDNAGDSALKAEAIARGFHYVCACNPGYGAGHNIGFDLLANKHASYHLVLNPDVEFNPNSLRPLLDFMDQHLAVGLLMPDIRYPDGKRQHLCKLLPTPLDLITRRFLPLLGIKSRRDQRYELREWSHDSIADIPALSGCFMLLRSTIFSEAGGFDQRYFMYMEDIDLCRRVGQLSRTVFFPEIQVMHRYAKGSYQSMHLLKQHIISAVRYFNKWGWFVDRERTQRNKNCLKTLGLSD